MKIDNRTHWNTAHLRAIITRVAIDELDPAQRRHVTVRVVYGKNGRGSSGVAYGRSLAVVRVASGNPTWRTKHGVPEPPVDKVDFAGTVAHELAHLRGVKHSQMRGCPRYRRVDGHRDRYAWAEAMRLERKTKPCPVDPAARKAARRVMQLVSAQRKVEEWQRRVRLAQGRLRGWTQRLRRLEKRAAQRPPEIEVQP